jgi:hypothetical protein
LFVRDGIAYVAAGKGGLKLIDVSNPAAPRIVGEYPSRTAVDDVYVPGSLAYIASGDAGLEVIDVSDPTQPVRVGGSALFHPSAVSGDGNALYVGTSTGFYVMDLFEEPRIATAQSGLRLFGPRGVKAKIERSPDLLNWEDIGELLLNGTQGDFLLQPSSEGNAFYRSSF